MKAFITRHPWWSAIIVAVAVGWIPYAGWVIVIVAWLAILVMRVRAQPQVPAKREVATLSPPVSATVVPTPEMRNLTEEVSDTKLVRLEIVGMFHYNFPASVIGATRLRLIREPRNPHDSNAIAVRQGRQQVGYVSASVARTLAPVLDANGISKMDVAGYVSSPSDGYVDVPEWTRPGSAAPARTMAELALIEPWGRPINRVELDGTGTFEAEIGAICERLGASGYGEPARLSDIEGAMTLAPSKRVGLYVDGLQVGWLPDDAQSAYRDPVARLAASGSAVRVTLSIWMARDYKFTAYVSGMLSDARQIEVPYGMPDGAVAVLPVGGKVQVTGEDQYLDELLAVLDGEQTAPVVAEMVSLVKRTARTEKTVVGIHIGGEPVGELTPHMSEHFLPVVAACEEEGVTLVCRGEVIGNQLKADVNLYACRGGDLPPSWISDNIYGDSSPESAPTSVAEPADSKTGNGGRQAPRRMAGDDWADDE
ncbi:HIRAN domain-containing protein [Acidipropionibacterium jensenii]|uniref:HIRAN domain-containing protein n=1 Tax=Acidipropionibacterium jensenii TaxID=1749 RepID=UPI00138706E4|nr:HIRAN domain-containing protein [Acidipropionibacterium jensenii]